MPPTTPQDNLDNLKNTQTFDLTEFPDSISPQSKHHPKYDIREQILIEQNNLSNTSLHSSIPVLENRYGKKSKPIYLCEVCNDLAKAKHYGVICCEGCKVILIEK